MKVEKIERFLSKADIEKGSMDLEIVEIKGVEKGMYGNEYPVFLVNPTDKSEPKQRQKLALWANDFNILIDAFGTETDDWIGKILNIAVEPVTTKDGKSSFKWLITPKS